MNDRERETLNKYKALLSNFISGAISASDFEIVYLRTFKDETNPLSDEIYNILDALFGDVDAFCADSSIRDDSDLDERQLLERAQEAYTKLDKL